MLHTVAETQAFRATAKAQGMTDAEREAAIQIIAADPMAGDLIVGSGGLRKVRVSGRGKGKSGGYRVITYFVGVDTPVFLLACLSKATAGNFSDAQIKVLASEARAILAIVKAGRSS